MRFALYALVIAGACASSGCSLGDLLGSTWGRNDTLEDSKNPVGRALSRAYTTEDFNPTNRRSHFQRELDRWDAYPSETSR